MSNEDWKEDFIDKLEKDFARAEFVDTDHSVVFRIYPEQEIIESHPGDSLRRINFEEGWFEIEYY